MHVCVLATDGVFDTGLASVLDTLDTARELGLANGDDGDKLHVSVCGVRRRVTTTQGLRVPVVPLPRTRPDVVLLPAVGCKTPETLAAKLAQREVADACALVASWSRAGTLVAAACTATFVVAQAGLLDGQRATTSWWLAPTFRERFPRVILDEGAILVANRGCVTAGAALSHIDLALWLVRRRSPRLARATASFLTFDERTTQSSYVMHEHVAHADPVVERFEQWARRNLARFSLHAAARALGTSERTLERRISKSLGKSPLSYVQDLRVERAALRLRQPGANVDEIAAEVGYADATTLRTLLRRRTGRGVRELRQRR